MTAPLWARGLQENLHPGEALYFPASNAIVPLTSERAGQVNINISANESFYSSLTFWIDALPTDPAPDGD